MAKKQNNRKRKPRFSELERLAYNLGQIERGKKNPDSKVHESYNNGLKEKTPRKRKPLI